MPTVEAQLRLGRNLGLSEALLNAHATLLICPIATMFTVHSRLNKFCDSYFEHNYFYFILSSEFNAYIQ